MTTQRDGPLSQPSSYAVLPVVPPDPTVTSAPESRATSDSEAAALQRELDSLRASYEQELARLRAEMAAQINSLQSALAATVAYYQSPPALTIPVITPETTPDAETPEIPLSETDIGDQPPVQTGTGETATSRRALLKWGGLAAAAGLAAAGGATLTSPVAQASDGGSLTLGSASNTAEHITTLTYNGSESSPVVLDISTSAANSTAIHASAGNGLTAYGVYATAGTNGNGVLGLANGSSSYGVWGQSDSGFGVVGQSTAGIDLSASGSGRLWQQTTGSTGAPTSGTYLTGEQIRDQVGDLYICVAGGSPGSWKKMLTLSASFNGGMIGFLSTPIRVYDSRKTGGALSGNAIRNVQVTGVAISGVQVPPGAVGCIGNLTVTGPTANGYVVIYPQGSSTPSTSTVNFLTNQTVANSFAVGLSVSGQVTVHSFTSGQCHFIVDITGFVS